MRSHCAGSHCALPGTGRHEWRPYGALPHVPLCRMFVAPRNDDTFPLRRFAPNVGAPLVTPGIPPHPRHQGRFIAACFRCAARPLRRGTTRCVSIAAVCIVPCRAPGVMNGAPTVHCRTFHCAACSLRHGTTTHFLCARFAPNVGAPPRTPGIPPHLRHHGRFTAACFRRAARPLRRGMTRCVSIAAVCIVPCRAPGVMNGAPTVHCRMFPLCRASVATRDDDTFPLRPVRTKRRGATPDARNTAAPAPSWTVHCRTFHCAACSLRHGAT